MTEIEYAAIKSLAACRFLPGSFDKRIAKKWSAMADNDLLKPMTDKGRVCLWKLIWKYRRQIDDDAVLSYMLTVSEHPKAQEQLHKELDKMVATSAPTLFDLEE